VQVLKALGGKCARAALLPTAKGVWPEIDLVSILFGRVGPYKLWDAFISFERMAKQESERRKNKRLCHAEDSSTCFVLRRTRLNDGLSGEHASRLVEAATP
jgi:hypothetical protein